MPQSDINYESLGFSYTKTDYRYVSNYKNGKWDEGILTNDVNVIIPESAGVLHYSQSCFEGLKAYRTKSNQVIVFRPELNAMRLIDSAKRLEMPIIPIDKFIDAIEKVVKSNIKYVPPYNTGAALYIRPVLFATGSILGVNISNEFQFRIFASPVGKCFKDPYNNSLILKISDFDRSAPKGTGHIKAGLNYAMSLHSLVTAHNEGFNDCIYLDAQTRTKIEEASSANIFFVTKDNKIVTPKSETILPSITKRSIMTIAKEMLNYEVEEREVYLSELENFTECNLCGTAAIISPVKSINNHGREIIFKNSKNGYGPISKTIYETLVRIQNMEIEGPVGWIKIIK